MFGLLILKVFPQSPVRLFGIRNEGNTEITKSDFCAYYTGKGYGEIEENSLIGELECDGLSNSGTRQLQILSKTGKISYNSGIQYR